MNLRLKKTPGIYVVGFMASGKSTIGRALAHQLGWSFFDVADEIESAEKTTIADILTKRGEAEFRRIEAEIVRQHIRSIERGRPAVLALCEGAFAEPGTRDLLLANGIALWLDCPFETVERRVAWHRSPARDPRTFAGLYESRREAYSLADVRIPIETDDPAVTVTAILANPIFR